MKMHVRAYFVVAILVMTAGWLALRSGNQALREQAQAGGAP